MTRLSRLIIAVLATFSVSVASASASVVWTAGAETPLLSEWANYSCADSSRVARDGSPVAQGTRSWRVSLHDGDDSFGERCELGLGNPTRAGFPVFEEGDERWIAYQVYLPSGFPMDGDRYNIITQLKQVNDLCAPTLSMHVERSSFKLFLSSDNRSSCAARSVWSGPVKWDHWAKLLWRVRFSPDPSEGFAELWGDLDGSGLRQLMPRTSMHTMKLDSLDRAMPVAARLGIYRDRSIAGDATAWFDGFTIATDRAGAELGAFGAGVPVAPPSLDPPAPAPPAGTPPAVDDAAQPAGATCRVPHVRRLRYRAARRAVLRAGCRALRPARRRVRPRLRGRVVAQRPAAGTELSAGAPVRLVVGR